MATGRMSCTSVVNLSDAKPVTQSGQDRSVPGVAVPACNANVKLDPTASLTISLTLRSADESGPSSALLGGSARLSVPSTPMSSGQAVPRVAVTLPSSTAPGSPAITASAATSLPPSSVNAGAANTASAGASAALGAAVSQSLGDGIRPMTLPPGPAADVHRSRGHSPVIPDMGSGGNGGFDQPPNLSSGTFAITQPDPVGQPGVYEPATGNPIPIGAVVALTATSPGPAITSYSWVGGSPYSTYVSTPAANPPPASQPAPTAPLGTGQSYGFIVSVSNISYGVTIEVTYQGGGYGFAYLNFKSVEPTGSLAVQALGTQTASSQGGVLSVGLDPGIQISTTATVGQYTGGQFMFMQIVDSDTRNGTDANNVGWFMSNTANFQGGAFNRNLNDDGGVLGYTYLYANKAAYSWLLSVNSGNTTIPTAEWDPPYMVDSPSQTAQGDQTLSVTDSFSTYLMYQPNMQGSVWIALSQINWSWSATATAGQQVQNSPQPNPGDPTTPSGAACFPTWVNLSSSYLAAGWQQP
jgi:hypothetical protein